MRIFCAETAKTCAAVSEYIFYVSANVWLLPGVFQFFLMNGWLLLKDINKPLLLKENVHLIFCVCVCVCVCVAASRNISKFFNRTRGCFWRISMNDCFWNWLKEKNVRLLLRITDITNIKENRLRNALRY